MRTLRHGFHQPRGEANNYKTMMRIFYIFKLIFYVNDNYVYVHVFVYVYVNDNDCWNGHSNSKQWPMTIIIEQFIDSNKVN